MFTTTKAFVITLADGSEIIVEDRALDFERHRSGWWAIPGLSWARPCNLTNPYQDFLFCGRMCGAFPRKAGGSLF